MRYWLGIVFGSSTCTSRNGMHQCEPRSLVERCWNIVVEVDHVGKPLVGKSWIRPHGLAKSSGTDSGLCVELLGAHVSM